MQMAVSPSKPWTVDIFNLPAKQSYPCTPELLRATATGRGNEKAHRGGRFWGKRNRFDFDAENGSGMLSSLTEIGNKEQSPTEVSYSQGFQHPSS